MLLMKAYSLSLSLSLCLSISLTHVRKAFKHYSPVLDISPMMSKHSTLLKTTTRTQANRIQSLFHILLSNTCTFGFRESGTVEFAFNLSLVKNNLKSNIIQYRFSYEVMYQRNNNFMHSPALFTCVVSPRVRFSDLCGQNSYDIYKQKKIQLQERIGKRGDSFQIVVSCVI